MGKKRIVTTEKGAKQEGKQEGPKDNKPTDKAPSAKAPVLATAAGQGGGSSRKRLDSGILHVQSTYNNTKVMLSDKSGQAVLWSSSGSLGFKGAKKGTPFAAAKVGEALAAKAQNLGLKEVDVIVKGVGSGRESAIRGFISKGVAIATIKDATPVPHNGAQPKKPRRV